MAPTKHKNIIADLKGQEQRINFERGILTKQEKEVKEGVEREREEENDDDEGGEEEKEEEKT